MATAKPLQFFSFGVIRFFVWGIFAGAAPLQAAEGDRELAAKVQGILTAACHRCHGENGANEGGFNYLVNHERLLATKKIVPGDAARSKVYQRLVSEDNPMPPDGEKPRPTANEIALVKRWIEAGAPDVVARAGQREFVGPAAMLGFMRADLEKAPQRDRRFLRYFTITHLHNAGAADDELESYRVGLSKLVNSLSWGRRVIVPRPIDPAKTVLRIDLRDYKWNEKVWDDILFLNPYGVHYGGEDERLCREAAETRLPHVRADWFVFAASRPPLYHDVLQLPKTDGELEKLLQVDVAENIRQERVARAGFNGSGVSRNNRLIERHESTYGAYWKSYDFSGNAARKNLFAHPLGPGDDDDSFQHDGGELIFNLPNGLQAYLLVDAQGNRIDKGPPEIVSDPKQGDRRVVNGVSCMSCHARGMIDKADQVREHVKKNSDSFTKEELGAVLAIYPAKDNFTQLLREDAGRFKKAVEQTGAPLSVTEPVAALAQRFEAEVDLKQAAAELGLKPDEFLARLEKHAGLARLFGALRVEGGTVQRELIVEEFSSLVRGLEVGTFVDQFRPQVAANGPSPAPTAKRPFNPGTLTLTVPRVGDEEKVHAFHVEYFLDKERENWIHLSETGCLAVTRKTAEFNGDGEIKALYSVELQTRKLGETEFTEKTIKRSIAVKHEELTDSLIYITDAGSIAVVKAKVPVIGKPKDFTHVADYGYAVRKAGEQEIDERTKTFFFEIYRDENTGLLVLLAADGTIAVAGAGQFDAHIKYSPYLHAFACRARRGGEADFTDETPAFGIELWKERATGALVYASEKGPVVVKGNVSELPTVAPKWVARFKLGIRKEREGRLPDDDRMGSVEIFRDETTGNLLYLCETGHIAVFSGR
jgi:hypothetical protein